jgi:uncharacterized membrane protein
LSAVRLLDLAALVCGLAVLSSLAYWWWRPEELFLVLLGVLALRLLVAPVPVPRIRPRRVVAIGIVVYAVLDSFITLTRHLTLLTHALDLGYYVQLTWNLARGAGPYVSLPEMHAWGDHFSPIMYLVVPLFFLAPPGAGVLLVFQSVALALGALAVFGIAARRLGDERPAAVFALLYLLNPSLQGINVRDFHAAALAIPLLLASIYFVESGRPWLFTASVLLTLATREDAAIPVIGLGLWLALSKRRWLWGAALAAGAFAVLAADTRWLMPYFREAPYPHLGRYAHLGRSVPEIVTAVLLHPFRVLGSLVTAKRLVYLGALFAPLAFLPLLASGALAGLAPALFENLLGQDPILFDYRTQYQSFVLPFLFLAAIDGYDRLASRRPGPWPKRVLVVAMMASLVLSSRSVNNFSTERFWPKPEHRQAWEVMSQVPEGAALSAHDRYVAHLSLRPLVFVFPEGLDKADHVLVYAAAYPWRSNPEVTMKREGDTVTITSGTPGPTYRYRVVIERGPHLLLRRS